MTLSSGPVPANIMIIADAPEWDAVKRNEAFSEYNFREALNGGLAKLNAIKNGCFLTYLFPRPLGSDDEVKTFLAERKTSPGAGWVWENGFWLNPEILEHKQKLLATIAEVKPQIIIATGPLTLWALAGVKELDKWRGSRLQPPGLPCPLMPTLPLDRPVRQQETLSLILSDFSRAKAIYEGTQTPREYKIAIKPNIHTVKLLLYTLLRLAEHGQIKLAGDLETRLGHIACFGIAWSASDAICIPFLQTNGTNPYYWTEEEEAEILELLQKLFRHSNVTWLGQNYLYDCQYFYRHWGFLPLNVFDTMIGHHAIFSNSRKSLDYLSSIYAHDHVYWKDEIKEWDPKIGEEQFWTYNGKDSCITYEIEPEILDAQNDYATPQHVAFQQLQFFPVLRMMLRGVRVNKGLRDQMGKELLELSFDRQTILDDICGHHLNPRSPAQLSRFFYQDLGIPGVKNVETGNLTTGVNALNIIIQREPALTNLVKLILELRSLGVFKGTFIDAELDVDDRMRSSFGIAGPTSYRYNSRENAFGTGMNMMNIPSGVKNKLELDEYIVLPNIRELFIPDEGYTFFDLDLDRADLQVVVWEAEDKELKQALRLGVDLHCLNACVIYDIKGIDVLELVETHPNYKEHRERIGYDKRQRSKLGVHATNYDVQDRTLAIALGITVHEASQFRKKWFAAHPGIKKWHKNTEIELAKRGFIENKFGARYYATGPRRVLAEFLGWKPQSTVAGVINRALCNIDTEAEAGIISTQLLLQVHDSLAGQFLSSKREYEINKLTELSRIVVPYDDPLIIPTSIKCSTISWGACK